MKTRKPCLSLLLLALAGTLMDGCSGTSMKSPDVSAQIRASLDRAGIKDVSARQDRDSSVVTLGGRASSYDDKTQAESIASSSMRPEVVSNQIAVRPPGD